jgi:predicted nucleic acid-binding protein
MSGKFFIDTNIFVYSLETTDPKKLRISGELITEAVKSGRGVVSYQVVQEFLHLALRRFANPMTAMEAERYLNAVFRPLLSIHSSPGLFAEALHIRGRYQVAWYDSLIVAAAIQANCDVLYSEDLRNGQRFGQTQIKNPFI